MQAEPSAMSRGRPAPDNDELARWIARVSLGDRRAFEQLYRATCNYLLAVAWRVLQRQTLAEEVLQDAFVKVWHSASAYDARLGVPMTWLINIVRNRAIDVRRAGSSSVGDSAPGDDNLPEALAPAAAGPEQWLDASIRATHIQACMGRLTAQQRQALALAYYRGMTHAEVADALDASLGTVKAWVRRGLVYLKACLEAGGIQSS